MPEDFEKAPSREWEIATLEKAQMIAVDVRALTFLLSNPVSYKAGQHYDIRLTAEGGYRAERSYSLASPPEEREKIQFGIQLLPDGEVSPYLFQLQKGDKIEVRGPIGGHFIWDIEMPGPLALIGGGSGMVPLMAMLRHHINRLAKDKGREIVFLISARTQDHVLYREELDAIVQKDSNIRVVLTITDEPPSLWTGYRRRIDQEMLAEVFGSMAGTMPMIYVCGPTPFVEAAANMLVAMGFNSHEIKTERFGG